MKTSLYIFAIMISTLLFKTSTAQINICVWCATNMTAQPSWGPVGYEYVDYYYMPAIEVYYNVPDHQFTYMEKGSWVTTKSLPGRLSMFNLFRAQKVVINEVLPYTRHEDFRSLYADLAGKHNQVAIRDSRDARYKTVATETTNTHSITAVVDHNIEANATPAK